MLAIVDTGTLLSTVLLMKMYVTSTKKEYGSETNRKVTHHATDFALDSG